MSEIFSRYINGQRSVQAFGIVLIGIGLFLAISFASHSSLDYPNSSLPADSDFNWGGRIGAYASYSALLAMGLAAYVWPVLMFFWGVNALRSQPLSKVVARSIGILGMALLFSIGSGLPPYSSYLAFKLGGTLGTQLSNLLLIPYMGRVGAGVVLCALFLAALVLTTDLSLRPAIHLLSAAGRSTVRWGSALGALPGRGVQRWHHWRARRAEEKALQEQEDRDIEAGGDVKLSVVAEADGNSESEPVEPETPSAEVVITEHANSQGESSVEPDQVKPVAAAQPPAKREAVSAPATPAPAAPKKAKGRYRSPKVSLLDEVPSNSSGIDRETLLENARKLEEALDNFDVAGKVVEVSPGPVVTRYEVEPAAGVKVNRIVTLSDDLARIMSAKGIRIQAPVPGKSVVGVEIANQDRETVYLREILEAKEFRRADSTLTMALGKTIAGEPYAADLAKMPHLLVAGATGAGKSVCINCLICSILFRATPDEVRFLMVDPKVVELTMYNDIPHLLVPVITEPKKASEALKWAVAEMEVRYQKLAKLGVRNLADYNRKLERVNAEVQEEGIEPEKSLPYIVIVVDEFADLMLTAPADVETSLMSLAQKSRAVGIHIILATQRPSVNVITGVIKANFPSRIAFQVASKTDSRTILDLNGAEALLGRGDMLFLPGGQGEPIRVHGAFLSGEETERMVEAIKATDYQSEEVAVFSEHADVNADVNDRDELFDEAVQLVLDAQQASTSFLQRRMKVGYSRAARLMDELENAGVVGPAEGAKPRQILWEQTEEMTGEGI